jgi:hypothetical protein
MTFFNQKPTCPKCGSSFVVCDATIYWNDGWEISDGVDSTQGSCGECDAQGITFVWVDDIEEVPA